MLPSTNFTNTTFIYPYYLQLSIRVLSDLRPYFCRLRCHFFWYKFSYTLLWVQLPESLIGNFHRQVIETITIQHWNHLDWNLWATVRFWKVINVFKFDIFHPFIQTFHNGWVRARLHTTSLKYLQREKQKLLFVQQKAQQCFWEKALNVLSFLNLHILNNDNCEGEAYMLIPGKATLHYTCLILSPKEDPAYIKPRYFSKVTMNVNS